MNPFKKDDDELTILAEVMDSLSQKAQPNERDFDKRLGRDVAFANGFRQRIKEGKERQQRQMEPTQPQPYREEAEVFEIDSPESFDSQRDEIENRLKKLLGQ